MDGLGIETFATPSILVDPFDESGSLKVSIPLSEFE